MADNIIVPNADVVVSAFLEKLYEKRPTAFPHLNLRTGVYWHPVLGYRAQAAKMLKRLVLLAADRRLKTAEGQALLDYVTSEFLETLPNTDKTFAEGTVTLGRSPGSLPAGVYPSGTKLTRSSFTVQGVTFPTAEYETLADAYIPPNDAGVLVTVPIRATRAGAHANTPLLTTSNQWNITIPSLVTNVHINDFQCGGGSEGADDEFIRTLARAAAQGQYGPTSGASKLGALLGGGVRHFLVYDDLPTASQKILIADESWGASSRWANTVQQAMYDADLVGFGCKVTFASVRNVVISVTATVALRDSNYLRDTLEIDLAIQKAVRSYFDDRPDWNTWNTDALKGAIARAHAKVFSCSSVTVTETYSGSPLTEILTPNYATEQFHYYLAANAMRISYVGPS